MTEVKSLNSVLVVDDEPLVLKYTCTVIAGLGYSRVHKARCAQQARDILAAESCALVICDVSLPDGDGRHLLREILEANPNALGVLITGFLAKDLHLPVELRDRVQILEKPFTADDISQVLAETFERRLEPVTR
jgi:DNA-binding NtrC family response regulator